jgi:hypothetical protein
MLDCLLDHKAHEHFFEVIDAPTLQLYIELLMRNIEKIQIPPDLVVKTQALDITEVIL